MRFTTLVLLSLLLTACAHSPKHHVPKLHSATQGVIATTATGAVLGSAGGLGGPLGAAIGGVAGTIIGIDAMNKTPAVIQARQVMHRNGVVFVQMGEQHTLIFPEDRLFYLQAPRITPFGRRLLRDTVAYLKHFNIVSLKVAAYTDDHRPERRNKALTRARAEYVVAYLTKQQLDTRIIMGDGYGSAYPIATNDNAAGRTMNRRLEISFRAHPKHNEIL